MWKQTKTNQMRTSKRYVFRTDYSMGVSHHHVGLAETQRQAEERGNSIAEKGEAPGVCG